MKVKNFGGTFSLGVGNSGFGVLGILKIFTANSPCGIMSGKGEQTVFFEFPPFCSSEYWNWKCKLLEEGGGYECRERREGGE
jgi:hypothetical protein